MRNVNIGTTRKETDLGIALSAKLNVSEQCGITGFGAHSIVRPHLVAIRRLGDHTVR